jgi:RHS repeat-associated protein
MEALQPANSHPNSWWQVDLQSVQNISSITVWGRTDCCPGMTSNFYVFVSDNPFTSYDLNTTLNQAGVSNFYVPGYSGTPGSINVNRTGRYVRVQLAGTDYLVLGEVQVWSAAAKVNWLVTDHLGTPRMVVDKTGSTAGISRHDYLPFGEEIFAGTGGRTTGQGYTANDGVRQQFTLKERDTETALDYFGARYHSSTQGRFVSADPSGARTGDLINPQGLNLYSYVTNNPLKYVDLDGLERIEIYIRSFLPYDKVTVGAGPAKHIFGGDGNHRQPGDGGGFRTELKIIIETDPNRNQGALENYFPKDGESIEYGENGSVIGRETGTGETGEVNAWFTDSADRQSIDGVMVEASSNEAVPLLKIAPGITYYLRIKVSSKGSNRVLKVTITGYHDRFPGYEIEIRRPENGQRAYVYGRNSRDFGDGPFLGLIGWNQVQVFVLTEIDPPLGGRDEGPPSRKPKSKPHLKPRRRPGR